jgi:hypothetical protein
MAPNLVAARPNRPAGRSGHPTGDGDAQFGWKLFASRDVLYSEVAIWSMVAVITEPIA